MIPLTHEAIHARRLELATVEEQIRALGRRKSVLRAEILSGYAAPVKGAPAEQLPLAETATATTVTTPAAVAPEAPTQAPEATKPATTTTPAMPLRERVRAALGAAKGRRSAKVLATLLGESEEDVADELEGLELAYEVIGRNTSDKAGRAYELRERWDARRGKGRDVRPGKVAKKPAAKSGKALWKPGYKPGILPSLTAEGNRRALEMIAAAPGKKMLTSVVRAALDLPDDCCTPNGCYYQGSQAGGDWWGIRDDGAPQPRAKKPAGKAPAKKAKTATKGKKASKAEAPAPPPAAPAAAPVPQASRQELLRKAILDELGHGLATFGELLTTCMRDLAWTSQHMPQTTEVRDVLRALCEEGKVVWDENKKVYHLPPPPAPKKAKAKKAPEAPRPTVTVGEAMAKMLAEVTVPEWQKAREQVCEEIGLHEKLPVSVSSLILGVSADQAAAYAVVALLEEAGAIKVTYRGKVPSSLTLSAAIDVDDEEIAHDLQALTRRYVRGLVEDWGGDRGPTTADLAGNLDQPPALVDSVLIELRAAQELLCDREGRWSVRSPKASAAARTAPLFDDVEPAPAIDGLEPEGDGS